METIHPVKDYNSYCDQCFVQFDKSWMLDQHLSKVHGATISLKTEQKSCENEDNKENSSKSFHCNICQEKFVDKEGLLKHIAENHPFQCDRCDANFTQETDLEHHINTVHNKFYKCNICDASYDNSLNLKTHLEYVHLKNLRKRHF
jgi:uncharacterized C2H2 Zn-finger protein